MHATVESLLQNYSPITLKEMDAVGFLNRMDTKYFFDARKRSGTDFGAFFEPLA